MLKGKLMPSDNVENIKIALVCLLEHHGLTLEDFEDSLTKQGAAPWSIEGLGKGVGKALNWATILPFLLSASTAGGLYAANNQMSKEEAGISELTRKRKSVESALENLKNENIQPI